MTQIVGAEIDTSLRDKGYANPPHLQLMLADVESRVQDQEAKFYLGRWEKKKFEHTAYTPESIKDLFSGEYGMDLDILHDPKALLWCVREMKVGLPGSEEDHGHLVVFTVFHVTSCWNRMRSVGDGALRYDFESGNHLTNGWTSRASYFNITEVYPLPLMEVKYREQGERGQWLNNSGYIDVPTARRLVKPLGWSIEPEYRIIPGGPEEPETEEGYQVEEVEAEGSQDS